MRQRGLYPAEHAILIMLASLLVSRVTARLEVVEHLDAVTEDHEHLIAGIRADVLSFES